jgi:trimethylamine--corrinoid protein Co-methyltransferase
MVQMGKHYGFPVYINVGLTDAKTLDVQAGIEKSATMVLGALAGADLFGHAGICGTDHGGSLVWLAIDNELMAYVKRIARGFQVAESTLATEVIHAVGPTGSFLTEEHTVKHFRRALWLPSPIWTRQAWTTWENEGRTSMAARALSEVKHLLAAHKPPPMDEALSREVDRIVACAQRELATA